MAVVTRQTTYRVKNVHARQSDRIQSVWIRAENEIAEDKPREKSPDSGTIVVSSMQDRKSQPRYGHILVQHAIQVKTLLENQKNNVSDVYLGVSPLPDL